MCGGGERENERGGGEGEWGGGNERNGPGRLLYNRVSLWICVAIMRCKIIKKREKQPNFLQCSDKKTAKKQQH